MKKECKLGLSFAFVKQVGIDRFLEYRRTPLQEDELNDVHKYFVNYSNEDDYIYIQ